MKSHPFEFDLNLQLKTLSEKDWGSQINFKRGVYYWFASPLALSRMNINRKSPKLYTHSVLSQEYYLVYIGIGPRDENTKTQFVRQRIFNKHLGKRIASSTFRLSIAALINEVGFVKNSGNLSKYYISKQSEELLSKFIVDEFCVCIKQHEQPWSIENDLIGHFQPPLNLDKNEKGWNYKSMKSIRSEFQRLAKVRGASNLSIRH